MITETQLQEAIAEMQGERHPDANTCIKLASYYTIRNEMFPKREVPSYSYSPPSDTIDLDGETELAQAVRRDGAQSVLERLDKIIAELSIINPALYRAILRELG